MSSGTLIEYSSVRQRCSWLILTPSLYDEIIFIVLLFIYADKCPFVIERKMEKIDEFESSFFSASAFVANRG